MLRCLVFFLTLCKWCCTVQDPNGATLALFNLYMHEPSEVSHQTVLQCVVYQVPYNWLIAIAFVWRIFRCDCVVAHRKRFIDVLCFGSGFGIRIQEGKNDLPNKFFFFRNFMFWSAGCSLLRPEGFFCNLDVLYGGLGISKLQFFIKKILFFQL